MRGDSEHSVPSHKNVKNSPLVIPENVFFPSLHIKLGLMKQFVKAVDKIFLRVFIPCITSLSGDVWADNPKGKLQDYAQRKLKSSPNYNIVKRDGPPHATVFTVKATLSDGEASLGTGANKQEAETEAAKKMIENLEDDI